jgi:quercetin dioxygenase-like cupin family protein
MSYRLLRAEDAFWRESNQMGVLNTDLAGQLDAGSLGARLWRLRPGQASTRHRHADQEELYILLDGRGRIRLGDDDPLELDPLDALVVAPETVRQIFNDTELDALWLVVGAPPEVANTLEMTAEQLRSLYPDGPRALPPELDGGSYGPEAD